MKYFYVYLVPSESRILISHSEIKINGYNECLKTEHLILAQMYCCGYIMASVTKIHVTNQHSEFSAK